MIIINNRIGEDDEVLADYWRSIGHRAHRDELHSHEGHEYCKINHLFAPNSTSRKICLLSTGTEPIIFAQNSTITYQYSSTYRISGKPPYDTTTKESHTTANTTRQGTISAAGSTTLYESLSAKPTYSCEFCIQLVVSCQDRYHSQCSAEGISNPTTSTCMYPHHRKTLYLHFSTCTSVAKS
jgi:hypothetical protein